MKQILRWIVGLVGVLFVAAGLRWLVDPAGAAATLGMPLLTGVGLSSQIGDMAAFFVTLGSTVLVGALTRRRLWFYPPMLLLGTAFIILLGRTFAGVYLTGWLPDPLAGLRVGHQGVPVEEQVVVVEDAVGLLRCHVGLEQLAQLVLETVAPRVLACEHLFQQVVQNMTVCARKVFNKSEHILTIPHREGGHL